MGEDESSKQMFDDDANDLLILVAGLRHHGSLPGNAWQPFTGQYPGQHTFTWTARPAARTPYDRGGRPPTNPRVPYDSLSEAGNFRLAS